MNVQLITQARAVEARLRKCAVTEVSPFEAADTIASLITALEAAQAEREHLLQGWKCECSTEDACRFARERDAEARECDKLRTALEAAQADAEAKFVKAAGRHNLMVVKTSVGYVLMDKGAITAQGAKP